MSYAAERWAVIDVLISQPGEVLTDRRQRFPQPFGMEGSAAQARIRRADAKVMRAPIGQSLVRRGLVLVAPALPVAFLASTVRDPGAVAVDAHATRLAGAHHPRHERQGSRMKLRRAVMPVKIAISSRRI